MKTKLLLVIIFISICCKAQFNPTFGVKSGVNYGILDLGDRTMEKNLGFFIGVGAENNIYSNVSIGAELLYSKYKIAYSWEDGEVDNFYKIDREFNSSSILVPVFVGYNVIENLKLYAGPQFDFNLKTSFKFDIVRRVDGMTNTNSFDSEVEDIDVLSFDGIAGVNYTVKDIVDINLRYIQGFSKIVEMDDTPRKSYIQAGIGYNF